MSYNIKYKSCFAAMALVLALTPSQKAWAVLPLDAEQNSPTIVPLIPDEIALNDNSNADALLTPPTLNGKKDVPDEIPLDAGKNNETDIQDLKLPNLNPSTNAPKPTNNAKNDVLKPLADNKPDEAFNKAVDEAARLQVTSQDDFITLFIREYKKLAPEGKLAELFATQQLKERVTTRSTDAEVEAVLRAEIKAAVDNSYNVLRTRIDRFGVVQPNIQTLEGKMGRIMVELPGIK